MTEKKRPDPKFSPFDRLPPHDVEAEEAVIAACLTDPEAVSVCAGMLEPGDFFRLQNGDVFEAICALFSRGDGVGMITVAHELSRRKLLEKCGGQSALAAMVSRMPFAGVAAGHYAEIVKRDARYRSLIHSLAMGMQLAYEAPAEDDAVFERASSLVEEARGAGVRTGSRVMTAEEGMQQAADDIEQFMEDPTRISGYRTGWWQIDALTDGLQPGDFWTIGAATSVGKSLFMHNLMRRFGTEGLPLLVFTTEMSVRSVVRRLVFMHAGIDPFGLRKRRRTADDERDRVREAMEIVRGWPLHMVAGKQTSASIRSLTRVHRRLHGVVGAMVDHMGQGFVTGAGDDEKQRIGDVTSTLKTLAEDEQVFIAAVSHVNREAVREKRLLQMADLYGSTHIEQDSSHILLLTPVEYVRGKPVALSEQHATELKQKHGGVDVWVSASKVRNLGTGGTPLYLDWADRGGRFIYRGDATAREGETDGEGAAA